MPTKNREFLPTLFVETTDFQLVFNFEQKCTVTIFGEHGIMAHYYTMMAKPVRAPKLHHLMIQFLIISGIIRFVFHCDLKNYTDQGYYLLRPDNTLLDQPVHEKWPWWGDYHYYNSDEVACWKIKIKPLRETSVGVAQTKTDPKRKFLCGQFRSFFCT